MAWTEPGKDKQPEEQKSNNDNKNKEQGPPDLDEAFRQLSKKFSSLFGGSKKPSGNNNSQPSSSGSGLPTFKVSRFGVIAFLLLLVIVWILSGIFIVSPPEQSVVLQFGQYEKTVGPGPHWIPRFINSETTLNVEKISNYSYDALMLTKDQNIVDVAVAVQYRISDAKQYLYSVSNPIASLQQATASALRQVIGNTTLQSVLTSGRAVVRQEVSVQLTKTLALYNTGIVITDIALQPARPPEQVKAAFDDAIKAQEDEQRYINQAQAYAMGVVPIAEGGAKRIAAAAQAYQQQVVLDAQAETTRYLAVLPVYMRAPTVTRERMYLSTMEAVLSHTNKVFIDANSSHNLLYLPFDKLFQHQQVQVPMRLANDNDVQASNLAASGNINSSENGSSDDNGIARPSRFTIDNPDNNVSGGN